MCVFIYSFALLSSFEPAGGPWLSFHFCGDIPVGRIIDKYYATHTLVGCRAFSPLGSLLDHLADQ
jgi:hypothetical protein